MKKPRSSGHDCHVTSLDGKEYQDLVSEYSAALFGHSQPEIMDAIRATLEQGINLGGPNKHEAELAKQLVDRFPSIEKVRFYLAAIILEPMLGAGGMIPATNEFLRFLRQAATDIGAVLIFDEIITSRLHIHGLQTHYDVYPDMTTLGKYLGGGFSFGAFGGNDKIMAMFNPGRGYFHSGTYNNNLFSMSAGIAAATLPLPLFTTAHSPNPSSNPLTNFPSPASSAKLTLPVHQANILSTPSPSINPTAISINPSLP
ncbi:hypothetical protein VTO58DRAFT_102871 [Aureobasidium pullulans]